MQSYQPTPPTAELSENHAWVRLTVDLPGVFAKDLDIAIQHGILTITGARQTLSVDGSVVLKKHKFSRRYAVDTDVVDVSKFGANLSHGVLTVRAPKRVNRQDRVQVKVTEREDESALTHNDNADKIRIETQDGGVSQASIAPVGSSGVTMASKEFLRTSTTMMRESSTDGSTGRSLIVAPSMVKPEEEESDSPTISTDEDGDGSMMAK